ncbi:MAG: class I SAM-dependent methyltransferase, partial [Gammaproteobacteria bacterium]|nr:class I SAM-dependent methyltransferase [Gammaproteobacteria bacterium]
MSKPFSQSCENNKKPIINVIRKVFSRPVRVLEIGSGTGQHAVYFAAELPHLDWYTSDLADNHPGINAWIDEAKLKNLYRPVVLDVCQENWPCDTLGGVFSANTAHIM